MCLHVSYNVYSFSVEASYLDKMVQEAERDRRDICVADNLSLGSKSSEIFKVWPPVAHGFAS